VLVGILPVWPGHGELALELASGERVCLNRDPALQVDRSIAGSAAFKEQPDRIGAGPTPGNKPLGIESFHLERTRNDCFDCKRFTIDFTQLCLNSQRDAARFNRKVNGLRDRALCAGRPNHQGHMRGGVEPSSSRANEFYRGRDTQVFENSVDARRINPRLCIESPGPVRRAPQSEHPRVFFNAEWLKPGDLARDARHGPAFLGARLLRLVCAALGGSGLFVGGRPPEVEREALTVR
jgi:hypothetical protein